MNPIIDQAAELRRLVRQSTRREAAPQVQPPTLILVAAAKTGAGASSTALQLAFAAARDGQRVVLGDIDSQGGDLAERIGAQPEGGLDDVLGGRWELHESLIGGPFGIQLLPGVRSRLGHVPQLSIERLRRDLRLLGRHADLVILDAGSRVEPLQQSLWDAADEVLLISTPDRLSLLDAYVAAKMNCSREPTPLGLLVNRAVNESQARDVHRRLERSSRRFLKTDIAWRGWLPYSDALATRCLPTPAAATRPQDKIASVLDGLVNDLRTARRERSPA